MKKIAIVMGHFGLKSGGVLSSVLNIVNFLLKKNRIHIFAGKDDFKIPENIYLTSLNYDTGLKSSSSDKNTIIEALKIKDINNINNKNLVSINDRDTIVKFRQFY